MIKLLRKSLPYKDESLLSYVYRLAKDNNCPPRWIIKECKLVREHKDDFINFMRNDKGLELLASACGIDVKIIKDLDVYKYFLDINPTKYTFFRYDFISNDRFKYCPLCIKEEKYHRFFWQLNRIRICLKHKVILREDCPKCGRYVTLDAIINDKCECSFNISQTTPTNCIDSLLIKNQQKMYSVYRIYNKNFELDDTVFKGIGEWSFYQFSKLIYDNIYNNIENMSYLKRKHAMLGEFDPRLYAAILTEQILQDWPNSFHLLLKDLNNIVNENSKKDEQSPYITNPYLLQDMILMFEELLYYFYREPQKDFIFDAVFEYIIKHYNMDFINKRFEVLIKNRKYISEDIASMVFSIRNFPLLHMFKTLYLNGVYYVKVEDIVFLISKLLKKANKWTIDYYKYNFVHVSLGCWKYNLSSQDLLEIIDKYPVDIIVNLEKFVGIEMIYVNEVDLKIATAKYRESKKA